jgi:hypothetical protein
LYLNSFFRINKHISIYNQKLSILTSHSFCYVCVFDSWSRINILLIIIIMFNMTFLHRLQQIVFLSRFNYKILISTNYKII